MLWGPAPNSASSAFVTAPSSSRSQYAAMFPASRPSSSASAAASLSAVTRSPAACSNSSTWARGTPSQHAPCKHHPRLMKPKDVSGGRGEE